MKFQIISDVHLEFGINDIMEQIPVLSDTICLLGDIGYPDSINYKNFIYELSEKFKNVFVITGNHEVKTF
jgi:predicted phosphodiesterase